MYKLFKINEKSIEDTLIGYEHVFIGSDRISIVHKHSEKNVYEYEYEVLGVGEDKISVFYISEEDYFEDLLMNYSLVKITNVIDI